MELGGDNMPIVLESNQNHAIAQDTEICTCLPASMGLGGGYVPMIVEKTDELPERDGCAVTGGASRGI